MAINTRAIPADIEEYYTCDFCNKEHDWSDLYTCLLCPKSVCYDCGIAIPYDFLFSNHGKICSACYPNVSHIVEKFKNIKSNFERQKVELNKQFHKYKKDKEKHVS